MPKIKRPRDLNELAKMITEIATGDSTDNESYKNASKGKGGLIGGKARAAILSPQKRKEIAQAAAKKRWNK